MFQWSSNRRSTSTPAAAATSNYPGQRSAPAATSNYPGQRSAPAIQGSIRPLEHTRAQHLDSYLNDAALKRSTRRIPPGDSTFDTVFQTVQGDTLILRITLQDSILPTMSLAGVQARHAWLQAGTMRVVGYPPLKSADAWRDSRLLLGAAVHEVVQELQLRPPQIDQIMDPNLTSIQSKQSSRAGSISNDAPPDYAAVLQSAPSMDMPVIPTQFDELDNLEREELDKLMENELDFQAFCNKLETTQTLQKMATSVVDDNAEAAEENISREDELKELHSQCAELQNQLKETVREFTAMETKQDKLCRPPDRRKVTKELTKAKREAFNRSEKVAEDWLENDSVGVEEFVTEFLEVRKLHHVRAAKLELLEHMGRC